MNSRQVFLGLLSVMLLLIFGYLLWEAFQSACAVLQCASSDEACERVARATFSNSMQAGMTTIGGLIAAIVVGELAITKPQEVPAARLFAAPGAPSDGSRFAQIASVTYVGVWALTGVAAYVWASLLHSEASKALTDYGNAWFGLAIASGYSYFGVNRG